MATRIVAAVLSVAWAAATAQAGDQRPSALRLFPAETVLLIRTADAALLVERLQQTTLGQLVRDPQMRGVVDAAWGLAGARYRAEAAGLGVSLEQLLTLPQGEVALGMINRAPAEPALLLLGDFSRQPRVARELVARLVAFGEADPDKSITAEPMRSDSARVIRDGNDAGKVLAVVERDGVFVACNDKVLLQRTLDRWDGLPFDQLAATEEGAETSALYRDPLAEAPAFAATMRELTPGAEEPPQAVAYADPIGVYKAFSGGSRASMIALSYLPGLGLDGVRGLGGALWLATETWDMLACGHLLLDTPRAGALKIARLEAVDVPPPPFVPARVESFASLRLRPLRVFDDIAAMGDRNAMARFLADTARRRSRDVLGVDFESELLANLSGSFFHVRSFDETSGQPRGSAAVGFGVVDRDAARETLARMADHKGGVLEPAPKAEPNYYLVRLRPRQTPKEAGVSPGPPPGEGRRNPVVGLIDDTVVWTRSIEQWEQFVEASEGRRERLADSLAFKLVRSRLGRLTQGTPPSARIYRDPAEVLRRLYRLPENEQARRWFGAAAERDEKWQQAADYFRGVEPPPLETLLKYATPAGAVVIDKPTGWSVIGFSFRRSDE